MTDPIFKRYLNDVRPADVAGDERVVAAREPLADLQRRHGEAAAQLNPLLRAVAELPERLAAARNDLDNLGMRSAAVAADVFLGIKHENAWRDHAEQLDQARGLVQRLAELVGAELESRMQTAQRPVRGLASVIFEATMKLDEVTEAARAEMATARMNA